MNAVAVFAVLSVHLFSLTCCQDVQKPDLDVLQKAIDIEGRPTAVASLGRGLDPQNLKEGDDLYFECSDTSKSQLRKITWQHDGNQLQQNLTAGIMFHSKSLVLQTVSPKQSGSYSCTATNDVGTSISNEVVLDIKYMPVCVPGQVTEYSMRLFEEIEAKCQVASNPSPVIFKWGLDNNQEFTEITSSSFTSVNNISILQYSPTTYADYGKLTCWATNEVGKMREPCIYQIVPIREPIKPVNQVTFKKTGYRGAVLEMIPYNNPQINPLENELENVRVMTSYALQAKIAGADIMVFPEQSLTSGAPIDRERFQHYGLEVPDPDADNVVCQEGFLIHYDKDPINQMSCAAKAMNMYMVFNVPEKLECNRYRDTECIDGFYLYNTNVVFDRKGAMIAKYRQQHLTQPQFDIGDNSGYNQLFTTDFNVTFGQHIGLDVMFYEPSVTNIENHNIRDFVMPTTWIDTLPFYTGPQVQYSWSSGLSVNLLAAGIHQPGVGAAGSGIFTGATDISRSVYIYDDTQGSRLLVHDITTPSTKEDFTESPNPSTKPPTFDSGKLEHQSKESTMKTSDGHLFLREKLSGVFQFTPIPRSEIMHGMYKSDDSSIDTIQYSIEADYDENVDYFGVFYSGPTGIGRCKQYSQIASLVYCADGTSSSCGMAPFKKTTKATFDSLNFTVTFQTPYLFPSIIDQDFQLIGEDKWQYTEEKLGNGITASIVISEPIDFLYSLTIIGRWYERDPECKKKI